MKHRVPLLRAALAVSIAASCGQVAAQTNTTDLHSQTFSQTIFFGDSLTDAGFFRPLLPPNAQAVVGQFVTNPGLVWSQDMAQYYGTDASAAWFGTGAGTRPSTGNNYAVGGARVATDVNGPLGFTPSLKTQVNAYLSRTGGRADPNALYTVWGGANDLFTITASTPPATAQATIGAAVTNEIALIGQLKAAGAQYILVPNIPDLGVTPSMRVQGAAAQAQATAIATAYNNALYSGVSQQNLRIIPLDTFNFIREVVATPAMFGFTNVTSTACLPAYTASALTCNPLSYASPDAASTYAFADGVHPSTAAYKLLADYAVATIEGPRQIGVLPQSAAVSNKNRFNALSTQLSTATPNEGMHWWVGGRFDVNRYHRGAPGDGFDGTGGAANGGVGWWKGGMGYGVALGYAQTSFDFGAQRGDAKQKEVNVTGFFNYVDESGLFANAQLGYTRLDFDVHRKIPLGIAMRQHDGSTNGDILALGAEAGYMFKGEKLDHGPVVSVLGQQVRVDGYTESGAGQSTALAFDDQKFNALTASVGYEGRLKINDHFTTSTRLAWQKDLKKNDAQVSAHMTSLGGMAYSVPGPQFDRDYLMLTTSARTKLGGIDLFAGLNSTLMRKGGLNTTVFVNVGRNF
ncbi:autotransporter domain-containing protein [Lysobacter sp. HDW10]|uniref:autotransporter domain-containing protein n=1 Tax=Lysobacter sp. HDW10 TaxID=2714936 RepID=UPI00140995FB|nr:autotransporter domain-containing protein [Lysobacter sp. HDW10]QIK81110.1 autotransporter domain-containing protein [Lysobacter sp. HDW10]